MAAEQEHPSSMQAWLYNSTSGGLKRLKLDTAARPPPKPRSGEVLVEVHAAGLNPVDYKLPEAACGLAVRFAISMPATPGMEFCGQIVSTGPDVTGFTPGQRVFGCQRFNQFGTLAQYALISTQYLTLVPESIDSDHAAAVPLAGQTAFQSIEPYVKPGQNEKVFINGGSGGCGVFAIQIAKKLGCHVTTTCSTRNVDFCRSLGADEVIDYTTVDDMTATLRSRGVVFDHIVDHIGIPTSMYPESHHFLKPDGVYVQVGAEPPSTFIDRYIRPRILGGGQRKYRIFVRQNDPEQLATLGEWISQGDVKVYIDQVFEFGEVLEAFEKMRSGRVKGKIIVRITKP